MLWCLYILYNLYFICIYTGEIIEKEYITEKVEHDFGTKYLYRIVNEAVYNSIVQTNFVSM